MSETQDGLRIREARAPDAGALASLRYEFRAGLDPAVEEEASFTRRCAEWMRQRLSATTPWRCWLAELPEGRVVGQLWLMLVEKIPNPAPELECHAYITNVYVRPEARGGAGERLLLEALSWCRASGVDSVVLWPTERSRSLYARHGFAVPADMMESVIGAGRKLGSPG